MDRTDAATRESALVFETGDLRRELLWASGFAVATGLAAHVRLPLPFTPVPVTMQTLVVLVAGGILGARGGAISQIVYLLMATIGLPVIAGVAIFGPTGGYLLAFVPAALVMGLAARRSGIGWLVLGAVAATLIIYVCGTAWLSHYTRDLMAAIAAGVLPFIAGDAIKAAVAIAVIALVPRRRVGAASSD